MDFGECLRFYRKRAGIRILKLAPTLGISSGYLSDIERGRRGAPSFEVLQKTAELLELSQNERFMLYDLAAETKQPPVLADDLNEYIYQNPAIRELLRFSMERQLSQKEWKKILEQVKKDFYTNLR